MKKSRTNKIVLFLTLIFITFQFIPLLGIGAVNDNNSSLNQTIINNSDLLNFDVSTNRDLDENSSGSILIDDISVFDNNLRTILSELQVNQKISRKDLKVILLFEEKTSKEKRIDFKGFYNCQGAPSPPIQEFIKREVMTSKVESEEYFKEVMKHPTMEDLQKARQFARKTLS